MAENDPSGGEPPELADDTVVSAVLVGLLRHWRSLRAGGEVPRRSAFDPMRVPRLLPSVFLLRLEPGTDRFRIRVFGTRLCSLFGRELTGQYIDEADLPEEMRQRLSALVGARAPFVLRGEADLNERQSADYEVLGLPMADEAGTITFILGGMDFRRLRGR